MSDKLNYQEALYLAENFMERAGIRSFCAKVCKGRCCKHCLTDDSCYRNDKRRLSCSFYICSDIRQLIKDINILRQYDEIMQSIRNQYHRITEFPAPDNILFFKPPAKKVSQKLELERDLLLNFTQEENIQYLRSLLQKNCDLITHEKLRFSTISKKEVDRRLKSFQKTLAAQT